MEEDAATYEPGDANQKGVAITPENNGFRTPEVAKKEEETDMQRKSLESNP